MSGDKKYYWLRLKKDFFKRHDIQIVEAMPNGKDYILFYLKLLVESVDHEGNLRFNDTIPYNEQMLSTITNTNIDIVRNAMRVFTELKFIEILDDQTIYMNEIQNMIGSETYWADQKRKQRLKGGQCPPKVLNKSNVSKECPSDVQVRDIDIDRDIDRDIDIDRKEDKYDQNSNEFRLAQYLFNHIKKNNPKAKEPNYKTWAKQFDYILRIDKRDIEDVKAVIRWCQEDSFWYKNILSPNKLREKFDTLYLQMKEPIKGKRKGTNFADYEQRDNDYDKLAKDFEEMADKAAERAKENIENEDDEYARLKERLISGK